MIWGIYSFCMILYRSIQYLVIHSSNDLPTLLVGMRGEWEGMLAAWMAWPDPGGRRGQVRRAAAGTGPDPVSGSGDSGGRAEADFFIKKYICPGSIAIGTKDLTHLSRIGCPGWKTGTKASSEPGLHALSVVVVARLI